MKRADGSAPPRGAPGACGFGLLAALVLLGAVGPARAGVVATVYVQPGTITDSQATFDVWLDFPGLASDQIEAIQMSARGSDPRLTNDDADFSRFSFVLDGATVPGWIEHQSFAAGEIYVAAPTDPLVGPFLGPSSERQHLGELAVDISDLPESAASFITLAADTPGHLTDVVGIISDIDVDSFRQETGPNDPAQLVFGQDSVPFSKPGVVVPEPLTVVSGFLGIGAVLLRLRKRRYL